MGDSALMFSILNTMKSVHGVQPSLVTYNTIIHALFRLNDWERIMQTYSLMIYDNIRLDKFSYNAILTSALCTSFWTLAQAILEEMEQRNAVLTEDNQSLLKFLYKKNLAFENSEDSSS